MHRVLTAFPTRMFGLTFLSSWIVIPLIIALLFAVMDHLFATLLELLIAPVWAAAAIATALMGCRIAWKRRWLPGFCTLLLPLTMLITPWEALRAPAYAGDIVRFAALKPSYDLTIAATPSVDYQVIEFNWGGMLFASDGVAYDKTDEIMKPSDRRAAWWQERERDTDLMCGSDELFGPVHALWDHYYLVSFGC